MASESENLTASLSLRSLSLNTPQENVKKVYSIVQSSTGSIGGNAEGGSIYGELTKGSMGKVIALMIEKANLSEDSRFLDVGCGLGKPSLHICQEPGVEFSCGIEVNKVRWMLATANLDEVLKAALDDPSIGHRCVFIHGDILAARYLDPFTHVYMFDVAFTPDVLLHLATIFNRSQSEYLFSYRGPREMVEDYGFNVELQGKIEKTAMHGSNESHTGYLYKRLKKPVTDTTCETFLYDSPCDSLFVEPWKRSKLDLVSLSKLAAKERQNAMGNRMTLRSESNKKALRLLAASIPAVAISILSFTWAFAWTTAVMMHPSH